MEYDPIRNIPPSRKDGYGYRMSWKTYGNAEVSVRNLPSSLYEWADDVLNDLELCWEAGKVAPDTKDESD